VAGFCRKHKIAQKSAEFRFFKSIKSPVFSCMAGFHYFHIAHPFAFYQGFPNRVKRTGSDIIMKAKRIETGTPEGDALGFSEDLFSGWLEMQDDHCLYLHYIISRYKNAGNTQALIRQWLSAGYDVRVVMPRPVMQHILGKFRFVPAREYFPNQYEDAVEVWYRPAWRGMEVPSIQAHAGTR
jgi:hypothetical protein